MKFEDIKVGETYLTTGKNEVKVLYKHEKQRTLVVEFGDDKLLTFSREFEYIDWKPKQTLANFMWVKHKNGAKVFITDLDNGYGFGISEYNEWVVYDETINKRFTFAFGNYNNSWQPMTEEEVVEFMFEEAKKRGYFDGVDVKCLYDGEIENLEKKIENIPKAWVLFEKGDLWLSTTGIKRCLIMRNGKWAEIQPDNLTEKIKELQELASEQGKNVVVTIENK